MAMSDRMMTAIRNRRRTHCQAMAVVSIVLFVLTTPAWSQMDLSGEWLQKIHEDEPARDVPQIGDYTGLPLNDAARMRADTWEASRWDQPEHECEPHPADYAPRGPGSMRVWADMDPHTMQVSAWHTEIMEYAPTREIFMDGRAHPPSYAAHTWEGFSTGRWDADMLEVDTDHLKEGWPRRNGLPRSSKAHMKEFFIRHSDYLTLVAIIHDPVYFSVPYVVSSEWVADPGYHPIPSSCIPAVEVEHPKGWVAFNLPGQDPSLEYARRYGIPLEAVRGGAETIRPEYQARLAHLPVPPPLPTEQAEIRATQRPVIPATGRAASFAAPPSVMEPASGDWQVQPVRPMPDARRAAVIDVTGYWMAIVDQDWRFRMMTAPPGETEGIPLNPAGMQLARAWRWQKDQADGDACKAYGAAGLMRLPERLHIHWSDDDTLRIDTDAGEQTRLLHFAAGTPPAPSLQGYSVARWFKQAQQAGFAPPQGGPAPGSGGSLVVLTTDLTPAYLRSNGVPYSAQARLLEYFDRIEDEGSSYLALTSIVSDPTYLRDQYITSYEYLREPDASHWKPQACGVPAPTRLAVPQLPGL
jgi:hypothetical protein